jgi:pimeloyl-ACP methyl ester carboxylesterase
MPVDNRKLIYLHGLESSSQSGKARQFAQKFPGMLTPDFTGSFEERMDQLYPILSDKNDWTIIGSSFGGLMGAVFTLIHPTQVRKLILLAPALMLEPFASYTVPSTSASTSSAQRLRAGPKPVSVPTVIVHGTLDDVVPLEPVRELAKKVFTNLTYYVVEDGHRLHEAFKELDWDQILL